MGIFKAYDIRGVYPNELDEDTARQVARALVALTSGRKFAVGRDMRLSSPRLWQTLTDELVTLGCRVDDLGLIPTEAIYFAADRYDYAVALTVTASHNPPEYNGFKVMRGRAVVRGVTIGDAIARGQLASPAAGGVRGERDVLTPFLEHVLGQVDRPALKPLTVVIDAGNGLAGKVVPLLTAGLPFDIVPLFFELDGRFPNRPSNPLAPGALDALKAKVLEEKADVGIAFDGDCDRVFFVDERGQFVPADLTLLLIAAELLRRQPGRGIVYNAICSRAVPEFVTELGGVPVRSAVGYANVKQAMLEHDAILGGEVSAHYAFPANAYADSGFIAMLLVLERLSRTGQSLSALIVRFAKYVRLDEVNLKVDDVSGALQRVRDRYRDARQDELDGVTVWYRDWWVNVRPSNTEPLLRVTVEAGTRDAAEAKRDEVLGVIRGRG